MKRVSNRWEYLLFLLIPFFLIACERRDPEIEFQKILDTPYTNVKEGIKALDDYIDYFSGKSNTHIEEIYKMAIAILGALVYMQNMQPPLFHRDIKPNNFSKEKSTVSWILAWKNWTRTPLLGTCQRMPKNYVKMKLFS